MTTGPFNTVGVFLFIFSIMLCIWISEMFSISCIKIFGGYCIVIIWLQLMLWGKEEIKRKYEDKKCL